MLFNSIDFLFFLPCVFIGYWFFFHKNLHIQNTFIIAISYLFYGWWDWRFIPLIFISSCVDYICGDKIYYNTEQKNKKFWLKISLLCNLGILGIFKYFNFFINEFARCFNLDENSLSLNLILPVGISFYTFQTMSYTLDIYKGSLKPTKNPIAFFAFVSFFPQLVAGPIERASRLLPQFHHERSFDIANAKDGLRQILFGLFKKIAVADSCAKIVVYIYGYHETLPGSVLFIGSAFFVIQVYGDFSGYSDIAIGCAKLFGIKLSKNFDNPYFSSSMNEFWRRWHISLSSWFKDYLYLPLCLKNGKRCSKWNQCYFAILTFAVSGLWHGANWTYILWGVLNGLYLIPGMLIAKKKIVNHSLFSKPIQFFKVILTLCLITFTWVLFRSENIHQAISIYSQLFSASLFQNPLHELATMSVGNTVRNAVLCSGILFGADWIFKNKRHTLDIVALPLIIRWFIYASISLITLIFMGDENQFIYFAF